MKLKKIRILSDAYITVCDVIYHMNESDGVLIVIILTNFIVTLVTSLYFGIQLLTTLPRKYLFFFSFLLSEALMLRRLRLCVKSLDTLFFTFRDFGCWILLFSFATLRLSERVNEDNLNIIFSSR